MNRITFYFVIGLALFYVVLTVLEAWMYQTEQRTLEEQRVVQARLVYAQRLDTFNSRLLRRLAMDSLHDPGLANLLKKHKVKVTVSPTGDAPNADASPGSVTAPTAANSTPQNQSGTHP